MSSIEEHIRRAIEEGKFDNLPGAGKPLRLDQDPFEDPEWRLAYHMLRSSGYRLPWIDERREIQEELQHARETLKRAHAWRERKLADGDSQAATKQEWERAVAHFQAQIAEINRKIAAYNLHIPSPHFQLAQLSFERELNLTISPPSDTLPT